MGGSMHYVRATTLGILMLIPAAVFGQAPDLDCEIRATEQQLVSIVGSGGAAYKAVYQYGLAPTVVGESARGAPVGYRLEFLVLLSSSACLGKR